MLSVYLILILSDLNYTSELRGVFPIRKCENWKNVCKQALLFDGIRDDGRQKKMTSVHEQWSRN